MILMKIMKKNVFCTMNNAECFAIDSHPMDSRFGIDGDVSGTVTTKLAKGSADGPLVILKMDKKDCFTMNERQISMMIRKDQANTIAATDFKGVQIVCYAIEGNVVDRISAKNGKGWCENISPTLNTQDRHAVVFALEGNGARPSHMGKGFSEDGTMYTLNTIEQHSVCYAIENHPADSRVTMDDSGIVQTLSARMGTGGGNVPLVLMEECNESLPNDYGSIVCK